MSKLRFLFVATMMVTLVAASAFAAPVSQPAQAPQRATIALEAALQEAARRQAQAQAAQQEQNSGGANAGDRSAAESLAAGDGEEVDEDYDAEVQALTGKRMTVSLTNAPPEIDGDMSDPEWNFAERVTDFLQRDPDNGQLGSERTEARVLFDGEAIYLGFWLYDSDPDSILARELRRDARLDTDDTIEVLLDTYHDRRNAYLFRVNALGTKYDAEVRNERQVNADWDERWDAAAQITTEGWFVELRIPFSALRFNTGSHVWGVDFKREIRRKNEEIAWSNYRRGFQFNAVSQAGNLVGLRGLGLTQRFRFQPYAAGSGSQFNLTDEPRNEADGSIGIENFKIQITPNLTADVTVNTDFAQVEDDSERVNLTRFPLFFPEKREFFLESASNFAFGSASSRGGMGGMGPAVSLYHSRNIGLVNGEPVPMLYGAKLTGKVGSTNIGFVNAQTGDSDVEIVDGVEVFNPGRNFTVLRLKQDVFERSTIGMIYTNAQGGGTHNRIAGVDATFRFFDYLGIGGEFATVVDDSRLTGDSEKQDNPITGRFGVSWLSDQITAYSTYQRIDPDFRTDLGFLRRRDLVDQNNSFGWNPRPSWAPMIRQFRISGSANFKSDIDGNFLEQNLGLRATTSFQSGDSFTFSAGKDKDRLDRIFFVSRQDNIYVLPGDYDTTDYSVNFNSYNARKASVRLRMSWGDYWDGRKTSYGPGGTIRFNEKFTLSPSYSYNHIDMPTGVFSTHTVTTRVTYNFNERWLTNSLVQYNSVSGRASVYARLRYVISEIDSFYLVYKSSRTWDEVWDGIADHQLIAKMTYSVDF